MRLEELSRTDLERRLAAGRLFLRTGPFLLAVRSTLPDVAHALALLYADFPVETDAPFADFHVNVMPGPGLRRWIKPQATFSVTGYFEHDPFDARLAHAFFEWGLNACIARRVHNYLVVHGAVVERRGRAIALVGRSGAGKSTLCAALVLDGWRLLSDELTLLVPGTTTVMPVARPISLKNQSVDIVRSLDAGARFGPPTVTLRKGTIRHLRPPADSVHRMGEPAVLERLLFVNFQAGAPVTVAPTSRAEAFVETARQSMNYGVLGAQGFAHLTHVVESCACATLTHGGVADAVRAIAALHAGPAGS